MRTPGFYWVMFKDDVARKPLVAQSLRDGSWDLPGTREGATDEELIVLGDRLRGPETKGPFS